jgi:DNA-directed RNA polymerase specialized sigma24 family protein
MKKDWELSQVQFDTLLKWLSEDREKAGEKYEEIRKSLVQLFELKGANDSQTLADETINRFTSKIETFELNKKTKPMSILFGFAKHVYLESLRQKEDQFEPETQKLAYKIKFKESSANNYLDYLKECLENRPPEEREMVLEYYAKDKTEKIEHRRKLAEKLKIELKTMHTRVHRIRDSLQKCIENKKK